MSLLNISKHSVAHRKEIIEKIIACAKKQVSGPEFTLLKSFIRQYYSNVPIEDMELRSVGDFCGAILSHWKLIYKRKKDECKIRVFNPSKEKDQWQSPHTIVEIIHNDIPFLVDSIRMELTRLGYTIHLIIHSGGMKVYRDKSGEITKIFPFDSNVKDAIIEAPIYMEIDKQTDPKILENIDENLQRVLKDVRYAVSDWDKMRARIYEALNEIEVNQPPLDPEDVEESKTFLRWLVNNHFTFLGSRIYDVVEIDGKKALRLVSKSGLGVLRDESKSKVIRFFDDLPPAARKQALSKQIIIVSETNTRATVHRPKYTDYVGVKRFNSNGELIGEWRFIGLYTSDAYNSKLSDIPLIRRKADTILKKSGLFHSAHAIKNLSNILETFPRDDIFQGDTEILGEIAVGILHLQDRKLTRLFVLPDTYGRYVSCLVYVPKDNLNTDLIRRIRNLLVEAFNGQEVSFDTYFPESVLARIHYVLRVEGKKKQSVDVKALEQKLIDVARSWQDDFHDSILEAFGEERGNQLLIKYKNAFPAGYREVYIAKNAVYDIKHLEKLTLENDLELSIYRPGGAPENNLRFKLYRLNHSIPLSDVLPILENMGLRVVGEQPYEIIDQSGTHIWINDFNMYYNSSGKLEIDEIRHIFHQAFHKIWYGEAENDGFNRLVLSAKLAWHEITILRAYAKFLRQVGFTFSQQYIEETFSNNPIVAHLIIDLFIARFDPEVQEHEQKVERIEALLQEELDNVVNLDEDRILRRYLEIIQATLRTNYFQKNQEHQRKPYLSFKFQSDLIPDIPLPIPMYETFVYSVDFEAVHLRAGKVARGGIRWSNRREDFRTEVLGLMKAQQVKNAVIVPAGAKGGFVVKTLPLDANREVVQQTGISCYRNFIRGLLDVADNLVDNRIASPNDTACYDQDDPYLVVAADKGTATFSDIANEISKEYNFWLDDAFASGGSTGYDHKKMGITARGAWESVKTHFQELQIDPYKDDFTVIGIGDMSGDVFGNGMLLSEHIKLVAAFNHSHIFIDPHPNPTISYFERMRLFKLPTSTWEDYDPQLISKGGGVYLRSAKVIKLSPEVRAVLNISKEQLQPNELIKHILKAPVDLLWNGGIGTYVKAVTESHSEIGDRTNDALRVNGNELHCRAVAEGGNLGFTQLGRIEYELSGGKINTDFIDNSAGVDCSDHEVNIKVLLNNIVHKGEMSLKKRNALLLQMTDDVADLVLYNNHRQSRAISFAVHKSHEYLELYRLFMDYHEAQGNLNRSLEFLPDDKTLHERKADLRGLTRPEIAVLMAYSKNILKSDILNSDLPENPFLNEYIEMAFPELLSKRFKKAMQKHHLRREIIATQLSNEIVTEMGITFVFQMHDENNVHSDAIAKAYVVAKKIFGLGDLWKEVEKLEDVVPMETLNEVKLEILRLARRATRWLILNRRTFYDIEKTVNYFSPHIDRLNKALPSILFGQEKKATTSYINKLTTENIPLEFATRVASCRSYYAMLNIIEAAISNSVDVVEVAKIYFTLMDKLDLIWFREKINDYPVDNHWAVLARSAYKGDLDVLQRAITVNVLKMSSKSKKLEDRINDWFSNNKAQVLHWKTILGELRSTSTNEFSMLTVAMRELLELTQTTR